MTLSPQDSTLPKLYGTEKRIELLDYWHYKVGANVIPADSKTKKPLIKWKEGHVNYQTTAMSDKEFERLKANGMYDKGAAVVTGLLHHGPYKGNYLVMIDADNRLAVYVVRKVFAGKESSQPTVEEMSGKIVIEQHRDNLDKAHFYLISPVPVANKTSDVGRPTIGQKVVSGELPAIEVHSESGFLSYCSPGVHKKGHQIEIIGTLEQMFTDTPSAKQLQVRLDEELKPYGIAYLDNNGHAAQGIPVSERWKPDYVVYEGHNRHKEVKSIMLSELRKDKGILTEDELFRRCTIWNQEHCNPPLPEQDMQRLWKESKQFVSRQIMKEQERTEDNGKNRNSAAEPADMLYDLAISETEGMFRDEELGTYWAVMSIDGKRHVLDMNSEDFQNRLAMMWKNYTRSQPDINKSSVINQQALNRVIRDLKASNETERRLETRCYFSEKEKAVYYDFHNKDYQQAKITENGYKIIDKSYLNFRRIDSVHAQVSPDDKSENGGEILDGLIGSFGMDTDKNLLFKVSLISKFFGRNHLLSNPIEGVNGSPEATKSTLLILAKFLLDPVDMNDVGRIKYMTNSWGNGRPEDARNRKLTVARQYYTIFDNIGHHLSGPEQDELCMYSTGGYVSERKLHTNTELVGYSFKGYVGYTSINDIVNQADVISRQLRYEPDLKGEKLSERYFWEQNIKNRPAMLHYIFTVISKAIPIYMKLLRTNRTAPHRLSDFAILGEAISQGLGQKEGTLTELMENLNREQNERTVENNLVVSLFVEYILNDLAKKGKNFTVYSKELYDGFRAYYFSNSGSSSDPYFPQNHIQLGRRFSMFRKALRSHNIEIKKLPRGEHGMRYNIEIRDNTHSTPENPAKECTACKGFYGGNEHTEEQCKRLRQGFYKLKLIAKDVTKSTATEELRKAEPDLTEEEAMSVIEIYERTAGKLA